jgi:hypothetical protein
MLSSVACPDLQYFSTLFPKQQNFSKTVMEHKICVLIICTILSETFLVVRRTDRDIIKNVYWSSCKVPVVIVRFERNLKFINRFSKNTEMSNFLKISPSGTELLFAEGQTDRHDVVNSRILQFANAPQHQPVNAVQ